MPSKANIFNIPSNYSFFSSLFDWLKKEFTTEISQATIFLPNQRSCRELRQLFTEEKNTAFLPNIKAISDLSYEDFFHFQDKSKVKEIINELINIKILDKSDYLFFLTLEVQKLSIFGDNLEFGQAFKIATNLQNLFEELEQEEVDLKKLSEIDDSDLSLHRQVTLGFLQNFYIEIKNSLLKKNIISSASYHNLVIQKFTSLLKEEDLKNPIIIAGSTGSISSSKKLIKEILSQNNGYVFLYGLDKNLEKLPEENHPQFFLNHLLNFLEIEKKSVKEIAEQKFRLSDNNRQDFISLMMASSLNSLAWQDSKSFIDLNKILADFQQNSQIIEAKDEIEEAEIITTILHENKNRKSAVITNNDKLAKLLKLKLKSLNLSFNDSRNIGVFDSNLIGFLLLILDLIENDFNSSTLLALLKNPLCHYQKDQETLANFEINILRQERINSGISGIEERLKNLNDDELNIFFKSFYQNLSILFDVSSNISLSSYTKNLIKVIENLSKKTWHDLLLEEAAQVEIFEFFEKLKLQDEVKINSRNSFEIFKILLSQISFFEKSNAFSSIQILSPVEARLLNYDLAIIASLNDGDFPKISGDNWLGKKIKNDLGINQTLKKIGQNAYDFCNYLSNPSFILTRSKSRNGAALIESSFLLKFKILCQKSNIDLNNGEKYFSLIKNFSEIKAKIIRPTQAKPKIEFRPKKISITEISKLISDPYSIYAKKILKLEELEKIDFEASYAEFGSFIHKALEEFVKNSNREDFLTEAKNIFKKYFISNDAQLIWWPKFENIFLDFVKKNEEFLNVKNYLEIPIKLEISGIIISGKIDRIVKNNDNLIRIFDYKTGQVPSAKNVTSGIEPQLTIAALAMCDGIIENDLNNANPEEIESLNYWKLSSSASGEIKAICKDNEEIQVLLVATKEGLEELFLYFLDENNSYISAPDLDNYKQNEYWHLSRIASRT